jgi:predicted GIY-YIG superfamily endonuclease
MGLIYKITNQINGKIYIGQTISTLSKRWREHCFDANNGAKTYYLY